jgi:type VI protein secretion system component Hcp
MSDYLTLNGLLNGEHIPILDVCTDFSRPITENIARRIQQGNAVICTRDIDMVSTSLASACSQGKVFAEGTFHVSAPTGAWTLSFSNGVISVFSVSGGSGGTPSETLTINAQQWSFNNSAGATRTVRTTRRLTKG